MIAHVFLAQAALSLANQANAQNPVDGRLLATSKTLGEIGTILGAYDAPQVHHEGFIAALELAATCPTPAGMPEGAANSRRQTVSGWIDLIKGIVKGPTFPRLVGRKAQAAAIWRFLASHYTAQAQGFLEQVQAAERILASTPVEGRGSELRPVREAELTIAKQPYGRSAAMAATYTREADWIMQAAADELGVKVATPYRILRIILGAGDHEMAAIRAVAEAEGLEVFQAEAGGKPVLPFNAYEATSPHPQSGDLWVECRPAGDIWAVPRAGGILVDHHNPGDRGHGQKVADAVEASSIGQVLKILGLEPTEEQAIIAALDHCAPAAVQGKVGGVDAEKAYSALLSRLPGGTPPATALVKMEHALLHAPRIVLGGVSVVDLRGHAPPTTQGKFDQGAFPLLQPVAFKAGLPYLALIRTREGDALGPLKVVVGGLDPLCKGHPEAVIAFKNGQIPGLRDLYGSPDRGFAGGYLKQ